MSLVTVSTLVSVGPVFYASTALETGGKVLWYSRGHRGHL